MTDSQFKQQFLSVLESNKRKLTKETIFSDGLHGYPPKIQKLFCEPIVAIFEMGFMMGAIESHMNLTSEPVLTRELIERRMELLLKITAELSAQDIARGMVLKAQSNL